MGLGSAMSEAEWESTRGVRVLLAYEKVGVVPWQRLTDGQRDEAVRMEAGGLDGAAYARECLKASGAGGRGGA